MDETNIILEEHHRRALSLNGVNKPFNIAYIKIEHHKSYNTIFGNGNIFQIRDIINYSDFKPKNVRMEVRFINGSQVKGHGKHFSKNKHKIAKAWGVLSEGLDFFETISYLNNSFFDPSYHMDPIITI